MQGTSQLESVLRRDRIIVAGGVAGVVALAWAYTVYRAQDMAGDSTGMAMSMPVMEAWGASDFLLAFAMWAVMMVAMMTPSAAPMVLLFTMVNRRRREQERPYVPTGVFLLGYLVVWAGFAVLATLAQWGLHRASLLSPQMESTSPYLGGAILLVAGVFQWSRLKYVCLTTCRSPLGFIMSNWRDGAKGALVMGVKHGRYCLGCCWALMGLLFVAGVMNLLWVAAIAAFVLVEKVLPMGQWTGRATGIALVAFGIWTIATALA